MEQEERIAGHHVQTVASELIFRKDPRCTRCGGAMRVSATYVRTLALISIIVGLLFEWLAGVRNPVALSLFWIPPGYLVLAFALHVAPRLVPPELAGHEPGQVTTLGLGDGDLLRNSPPIVIWKIPKLHST